ncbi:MAG: hypothetical protein JXQ73_24225 [Phycisphaerae bacterium]|nr:hypothetical protein [Phycisphaerae bacterium]
MTQLLPNRLLLRFEVRIRRFDRRPRIDGRLRDWDDRYRLPALGEIDGKRDWGDVYIGWDEDGLYVACRVREKVQPVRCDPQRFRKGDNFRVLTDMRDTRNLHRASRYCQHFYFLASGGGRNGRDPVAGAAKISRATQHAPLVAPGRIEIASHVTPEGYALEAHIPAKCLAGFDPVDNPRIGLYTMLEDGDHGQQYLTVGDDMPWWVDPSLWATGVLV